MRFAYSFPWGVLLLILLALGVIGYTAYARPVVPLSQGRRLTLMCLRAAALLAIVVFLLRPVKLLPPAASRDAVVPVLVDVSRSMGLTDAGAGRRIERAAALVEQELVPRLGRDFRVDVLTFGEALAGAGRLSADARRTDLSGALRAARERYRGQRVAGIILVSDGGDTGGRDAASAIGLDTPPVFPIGIGSAEGVRDREVLALGAGEATLDNALVDLTVSAVSHGFGEAPVELRLLVNGRAIETRRVRPPADGSPIHEVFQVSPDRASATLYSIEIPSDPTEIAAENNRRSVLVSPPGRKRRLLLVEGSPGFEHSFLKRAWAEDSDLEVDSIVRKGKNDQAEDTFFVQAAAGRTAALGRGYPTARTGLFTYDAIVFANIEGDFFGRDQLAMTADFVAERGGGLLVLGSRSFAPDGLIGTPLEEVLPLDLNDRRDSVLRTAAGPLSAHDVDRNKVLLTREGEQHPATRIASTLQDNRTRWAALPALPWVASLGGPRPGAQVLAVAGETVRPLLAVQQYGHGRSAIFAGEGSWRWRMLMPHEDSTHQLFWRQMGRWLSSAAQDPVTLIAPVGASPGDLLSIDVLARDPAFAPVRDGSVALHLTLPGGERRDFKPVLADPTTGRYTVPVRLDRPGIYRVSAEARRGNTLLGASEQSFLVGGADLEFADPRLNEDVLRRLAVASGGRYLTPADAQFLPRWLTGTRASPGIPEEQDVWHHVWALLSVIALLSTEWVLRRRWGLR